MTRIRIIARVELKPPHAVKGVQCEGIRAIGNPADFVRRYYEDGADEVFLQDVVASLYGRGPVMQCVEDAASPAFVPVTYAGGVDSGAHVRELINAGVERVCVGSVAVRDPYRIRALAELFGCSTVSLLVEAKRVRGGWECYVDGGREPTGVDVLRHVERCAPHVAEVVVCSVDRDGTGHGFDCELLRAVAEAAPHAHVVAAGGFGRVEHAVEAAACGVTGIAIASALHRASVRIVDVKAGLRALGLSVRAGQEARA